MASLYAGEEELLDLLESLALADDPMFVTDDRHRIVFWNRAIEQLLGRTHDEVAGRGCEAVIAGHDDYGNAYCSESCPVQLIARRGEQVRHFALRTWTKAGKPFKADVSVIKFTLRRSRRVVLAHVVRQADEPYQEQETASVPVKAHSPKSAGLDLTGRETEILTLLAEGRNARQIADRLGISPLTARNHIQHVMEKLGVHSQSEAVAFAWKMHLI